MCFGVIFKVAWDKYFRSHVFQLQLQISQLLDLIDTWGFREDIKDVKGIGLIMMTTMRRRRTRWRTTTRATTTRTTTMTMVSQLWD